MVLVNEAETIILGQRRDYGVEAVPLAGSLGRVLAANIYADRDMPPFNRVTMDGIAIRYGAFKHGIRTFQINAIQAAGVAPIDIQADNECIEIMTGAALPSSADTIVPYEDLRIVDNQATITTDNIFQHQNIHRQGKDKLKNQVLAAAGLLIDPTIVTIAASVGQTMLTVKTNPRIIIVSTGDELVDIHETPAAFQIRRSNSHSLQAALKQYGIPAGMIHLPDDPAVINSQLQRLIDDYDVILLSGGVSMGKFDYVPEALEKLEVKQLFHKVRQRPGKPFWFGTHPTGPLVFAFPGNPVSTFLCFHRYFLPWLRASWKIGIRPMHAILNEDFSFRPALQYFLQVKVDIDKNGRLLATPVEGNGSGDFANLLQADAFLELPMEQSEFKKGEVFPLWPFKQRP